MSASPVSSAGSLTFTTRVARGAPYQIDSGAAPAPCQKMSLRPSPSKSPTTGVYAPLGADRASVPVNDPNVEPYQIESGVAFGPYQNTSWRWSPSKSPTIGT